MTENILTLPTDANPLLTRALLFLESGDFASAKEYCDRVLDAEPKNPFAYLAKLMAKNNVRDEKQLVLVGGLPENPDFKFARRFAAPELAAKLDALVAEYERNVTVLAPLRAACAGRQQTLRQLLSGGLPPEVAAEVQKRLEAEQALMLAPDEAAAARETAETNALVAKVLIRSQLAALVSRLENARSAATSGTQAQMLDARIETANKLAKKLMNAPSPDPDAAMAEIRAFSQACSKDLKELNSDRVAGCIVLAVFVFVGILIWSAIIFIPDISDIAKAASLILMILGVGAAIAIVCIYKLSRRNQ